LSIAVAFLFKLGSLPWMDQMALTFLASILIIVIISLIEHRGKDDAKGINLTKSMFKTTTSFNISAFIIMIVLAFLYSIFW